MIRYLFQIVLFSIVITASTPVLGQTTRWQQRVKYSMDVKMDAAKNQYTGTQKLVYFNHSPDTLDRIFYHLYNNAFQPGSMMDERSQTILDPDRRVKDRISKLNPSEIGYLHIKGLLQDGVPVQKSEEVETIQEVVLAKPILPGDSTVLELSFQGQVPVQIRRSGRDNAENIRFSMAQWYPKLCEYDYMGWHANPYVGREFHGVWGDFDVTIHIAKEFTVAATGYLQFPNLVGHGYENKKIRKKRKQKNKVMQTWRFIAPNVHDFVWAADPNYKHTRFQVEGGPELHFFYVEDSSTKAWEALPAYVAKAFTTMNARFGKYPYKSYSVVQAGDGGMEYPMATLVTGKRKLRSLVGVATHELIHSWFQGVLAFNESLYSWMDEGFTSYATHEVTAELFPGGLLARTHLNSYLGYYDLLENGVPEPMTTHADHYQTNRGYATNAYSRGAITLHQLSYVIGQDVFDRGMRAFFDKWKFRHPNVNDFKRVMEKTSGLELDWYFEYWINTIHSIDYSVVDFDEKNGKATVELRRFGNMPMPIEMVVTLLNGKKVEYYMPLQMMRGEKVAEVTDRQRIVLKDWPWTHRVYTIELDMALSEIETFKIDP
ncbi:MAG TPA: M1 family peptidase, partial [Bacteroidetes bacterium]|nr:M1 family peptidase [Bacteroidota bacterium]